MILIKTEAPSSILIWLNINIITVKYYGQKSIYNQNCYKKNSTHTHNELSIAQSGQMVPKLVIFLGQQGGVNDLKKKGALNRPKID